MKKIINLICALALLFTITACSTVPAGNVGVKVYLLGNDKGVSSEKLGVGRYWIGYNEQLFTFPTFTQNYTYTSSTDEGKATDESITFQTVESMSIRTNVGVSYHIDADDAVKVFQKYREGVKEITAGPLRNEIRNDMIARGSKYTVERILGVDKQAFMDSVRRDVAKNMTKVGITVENLYLVGDLIPPQNIRDAINGKIQATQDAVKAENRIREAYAEAKRDSVLAAGKQKANHQLEQSLSQQLLQKMWIDKWDGHLPQTQAGAGSNLYIPVSK
jgi:regulator of protease activity HflC (stomatin/prohibitin superfamily)